MSVDTGNDALRQRMGSQWNASSAKIVYDNTALGKGATPWVRFSVIFTGTRNRTFGDQGILIEGMVKLQVFVDLNTGEDAAMALAQAFINIFENQRINDIFLYTGSVIRIGKDPINSSLYQINAEVPFQAT